jgi:hypothetical protein
MPQFQVVDASTMEEISKQHNIWARIRSGKFRTVVENRTKARMSKGGHSYIISYYEQSQYVCTIHRIVNKQGNVVHEHIKNIEIEGNRYRLET